MKPKLTPVDLIAYANAMAIPEGTPIALDGKSGVMLAMSGHMLTVKVGRTNLYLRAGDPRVERISAHAK